MLKINPNELAGLSPAERMRGNIERFVGESAGHVSLMTSRMRRRAIRTAMDDIENNSEHQVPRDKDNCY
jgi:hypothetical protein